MTTHELKRRFDLAMKMIGGSNDNFKKPSNVHSLRPSTSSDPPTSGSSSQAATQQEEITQIPDTQFVMEGNFFLLL